MDWLSDRPLNPKRTEEDRIHKNKLDQYNVHNQHQLHSPLVSPVIKTLHLSLLFFSHRGIAWVWMNQCLLPPPPLVAAPFPSSLSGAWLLGSCALIYRSAAKNTWSGGQPGGEGEEDYVRQMGGN